MYDTAKKAREAMKSKARRLAGEKDQKVDSSDWSPAEPLNTEVKTGMRPISRRAYKSGGKVMGEDCSPRMDRKPRKSGGAAKAKMELAEEKSEATEYAKAKVNRNVKDANQEREGIKHIGGLRRGGRAKKNNGGGNTAPASSFRDRIRGFFKKIHPGDAEVQRKNMEEVGKGQASDLTSEDRSQMDRLVNETGMKRGGRSKRASGGATTLEGQKKVEKYQQDLSKPSRGKAEHYKKGGRATGGPVAKAEEMMKSAAETSGVPSSTMSFTGVKKGMLSPLRGAKKGGRIERKAGGRAKAGKGGTKINIMIAAGKPASPADMMPPPGPMGGPPPGLPVPIPGMDGGAPPPMPMPMPAPAPAGGPPMGMPPGMPMPRKTGGRVTKVASSYKDMEAGAGSAEGRLQKTDIAKKGKGAPTYKRGGKVYRSYKDMDAGAGSGEGRLEKTEIEKHKK